MFQCGVLIWKWQTNLSIWVQYFTYGVWLFLSGTILSLELLRKREKCENESILNGNQSGQWKLQRRGGWIINNSTIWYLKLNLNGSHWKCLPFQYTVGGGNFIYLMLEQTGQIYVNAYFMQPLLNGIISIELYKYFSLSIYVFGVTNF